MISILHIFMGASLSIRKQNLLEKSVWISFSELTLSRISEILIFQNYLYSPGIDYYGICFR